MSQSPWVTEQEASRKLGVKEETLRFWREIGYLKPGTHWRNSFDGDKTFKKGLILYHLRWSKEVIKYWKDHDAPIVDLAA